MKELKKMLTIFVALLSVALPACQSNQKEEDHLIWQTWTQLQIPEPIFINMPLATG